MIMAATIKADDPLGDNTLGKVFTGAIAGAIGVWALDRIDWFMWNREGDATRAQTVAARPGGEPPAQALVSKAEQLAGQQLSGSRHELVSQAVHYSIGIGPAIGYALLRNKLPGRGVARGAAYGVALFVAQDEVLNTVTGLGGRPSDYPWTAHARGLLAHTVYGIATELTLNLLETARTRRSTAHSPGDRANSSSDRS
jgi:uncharacterized membrane protein YagU involved in acid resistance